MENLENEIWKDIQEYEGVYMVSNKGRVKSCERLRHPTKKYPNTKLKSKILSQGNNKGYLKTTLCKEGKMYFYPTHRLVAMAFIPNIHNKREVNHINGIKTDNNVENLEWVTSSENKIHGFKNNFYNQKGELNNYSKLKKNDVEKILQMLGEKSVSEISKAFEVSDGTIYRIINGKRAF